MKTKSIICFLLLLAIVPSFSALGQKDVFSGEGWHKGTLSIRMFYT